MTAKADVLFAAVHPLALIFGDVSDNPITACLEALLEQQ
jgi:hypothetical protein